MSAPPNATPNELALYNQVQALTAQLANLSAQFSNSSTGSTPSHISSRAKINSPTEFKGSRDSSRPFLGQCELVFDTRPDLYPDGSPAQVNFAASYLRDTAFLWFQTFKSSKVAENVVLTYPIFKAAFLEAFGETDLKAQSTRELNRLIQKGSVATYSTTFNRHAANTGLNDEALQYLFNQGLKDEITELLLIHDSFTSISDLQNKAIKIDNRLFNLRQKKKPTTKFSSSSSSVKPAHSAFHMTNSTRPADSSSPMQVDATLVTGSAHSPLSKEEKIRRKNNSLCGYCGERACGGFPDLSKCSKLAGRPGFQPRRTA